MITIDGKTYHKTLLVYFIVGIILGAAAVYCWSYEQAREYQNAIDTITDHLSEARAANTDAAKRVTELENLCSSLGADLAASRKQVDAIKSGIGNLEGGLEKILRLNREGQQRVADIIQRDESKNGDP